MKHLRNLLRLAVAVWAGIVPSARAFNAHVEAIQVGTNFSYFVYNDEISGSALLLNSFHLTTGAPFSVTATPDGWTYRTDNATYIDWFATNSSPPFDNNILPGAFLAGFSLQSIDPSSEELGCALASWDSSTNACGPSLISTIASPSVTNLESTLMVVTNTSAGFQFSVAGFPPFSYGVESSSNFLDWSSLTTNPAPFILLDTANQQARMRFFRSFFSPDATSWPFLPD
jgi:hypothetical protein